MRFRSQEETFAAGLAMKKWLPELVSRIEEGLREMGVTVEQEVVARFQGGGTPFLLLCGRSGWEIELNVGNALTDFLTLGRGEEPMRLDPRLSDKEYAETKLQEVVKSRLAMVRAMNESGRASDVAENVRKHGGKYGRYRVWEYEDESDQRDHH